MVGLGNLSNSLQAYCTWPHTPYAAVSRERKWLEWRPEVVMWACNFLVVGRDLAAVAQRCKSDSHSGAVAENRCFSVRDRGGHWAFMN